MFSISEWFDFQWVAGDEVMLAAITAKPRACHPGWVGLGNGGGDTGSRAQIFHSRVGCQSLPGAHGPLWLSALDVHLQGRDGSFDLCSSCIPLNCFEPQLLI